MQIKYQHSHLNGLEYLTVHFPYHLQEIINVINNIDADNHRTKVSKEHSRIGQKLYSPKDLNAAFRVEFRKYNWDEHRQTYYATPDEQLAQQIMSLPPDEQKKKIQDAKEIPYQRHNQTDFMKDKIAIEVQFGKYPFVSYDIFVKHMAFYVANEINVGVEIMPTNKMLKQMSSGPANYEGEIFNLYRQGRNTPAVPLWILGIEP